MDPYTTTEQHTTQNDLDTDLTPVAKSSDLWTLLHGAEFGKTEVIEGSITTFDTDLFTVSFRNREIGLAGGSACTTAPVRQAGESDTAFGERASQCRAENGTELGRVPALYRYTEPKNQNPRWDRLALPDEDDPGYIGAIAWIDNERALIVGGTGTYPRREPPGDGKAPTDPTKTDPAGKARAWVYRRSEDTVEKLDLSAFTPDEPNRAGMRGLTAAECYSTIGSTGSGQPIPGERCFAGALGQIWEWRDGAFNGGRIDAMSPESEIRNAKFFRYRVRDITGNLAATAGCCPGPAEPAGELQPRTLTYLPNDRLWFAQRYADRTQFASGLLTSTQNLTKPLGVVPDLENIRLSVNDDPDRPDSIYAISSNALILTPGGPSAQGEPGSIIGKPSTFIGSDAGTMLNTTRLLAGEGNNLEWAAGELRSSRLAGLGAHGIVVIPASLRPTPEQALNPPPASAEDVIAGWEAVDRKKLDAAVRSRYFFLPSYSANAIDIVGNQDDGWIVGDRGAIVRLSSNAVKAAEGAQEPAPPQLRKGRSAPLSERSPYADTVPAVANQAGLVPPLGSETETLPEPRPIPAGTPGGAVNEIVMSRDGSEGWAIGTKGASLPIFYRFDGASWSECDPLGIPGELPPDPACKALAPLVTYKPSGASNPGVPLLHAARVPLENDSDPTNDDDLEIVVAGGSYQGPETAGRAVSALVRYSKGRWRFEPAESLDDLQHSAPVDVAFTAPDDGWLIQPSGVSTVDIFHFDGTRWSKCVAGFEPCGDPANRLSLAATGAGSSFGAGKVMGFTTAGERVFLFGWRGRVGSGPNGAAPLIIYRDRNGKWTDGSGKGEDRGGFDPMFSNRQTEERGIVESLAIARRPNGGYEGWAFGRFGGIDGSIGGAVAASPAPARVLMRLEPGQGWSQARSPGPLEDYMMADPVTLMRLPPPGSDPRLQVSYPSELHPDAVFVGQSAANIIGGGVRIFAFNSTRRRFELVDTGTAMGHNLGWGVGQGRLTAMASDGGGGFWAAVTGQFLHYTDNPPKAVFEDVPSPFGIEGAELRDLTMGPDGSIWVATSSDRVYRYERGLGWDRARVPGWDPGRIVVRPSKATAIAIGPGGDGVLVGEGGRIADLSANSVSLNPAAGRSCALGAPPPCGTSRDLSAVDIAPDGSALVAGKRLTLLWRSAGGEFQSIAKPPVASSRTIEAVSMPTPTRAYLATDGGLLFRGEMSLPGEWRWRADNPTVDGKFVPLALDPGGKALEIRDFAVDAFGHGYAVGERGFIVERSEGEGWKRLPSRYGEDRMTPPSGASGISALTAVELSPGGEGVLIGGEGGKILAGSGSELWVAHPSSLHSGAVVGLAYLPGTTSDSVDAWAGIAPAPLGEGDSRLLRYSSDPSDPLLDPTASTSALRDSAGHADGELSVAAFGKSECDAPENNFCSQMAGTTTVNEVLNERIIDELVELREHGEVDLAIHSGDATDSRLHGSGPANLERAPNFLIPGKGELVGALSHRRYAELVANELEDRGVPFFGAIGGQDLSEAWACEYALSGECAHTKAFTNAGENYAWREAFAARAPPWGNGTDSADPAGELEFVPAEGSEDFSLRVEDQAIDADGDGELPQAKAEVGGASTHYALDALRNGEPVARIVVVDTSLRSLSASDPIQQPQEIGGQARFLERMICLRGDASEAINGCTREPGQAAIVVSNTPTYSYGPGALSDTATDASTFETLLLRHDVNLVISGALGFNGLYYTLAPGIHDPCPGGEHPEHPPRGLPSCAGGADSALFALGDRGVSDASDLLAEQRLTGAVPTLIASGAGGKFGPTGRLEPDGPAGRWHGYSIARLQPDGEVVIEQRPILDWVGLDAADHVVEPRSKLALNGYGRSPVATTHGTKQSAAHLRAFYHEISNAAITHRYDLVLADPNQPWLPCEAADPACAVLHARLEQGPRSVGSPSGGAARAEDGGAGACEPYLCLPERIGTVDRLSGEVRAGSGKYPDTFAVAILSVDEKIATWPLVFKRSPSFVVEPASLAPPLPAAPQSSGSAPPPPPPPASPAPKVPQASVPAPPAVPPVAPLQAAQPPEPAPPAPPAPPPPTEQPSPLSLVLAPPGIAIATPTAVIQPPTPPVNPAPPGGARREARQRQAATQKSGADSDASSEMGDATGDLAQGGDALHGTNSMTRRERLRAEPSFSAITRAEQPSAWAQGLLYTGGAALLAATLAFGWSGVRPTPRRGSPEVPAPAFARVRGRRR